MTDAGARKAARAIDALRRGWPYRVIGADGALDLLAVESARDTALDNFGANFGAGDILLSGERAVTLKLTNQRPAATPGPPTLRSPRAAGGFFCPGAAQKPTRSSTGRARAELPVIRSRVAPITRRSLSKPP